MMHKLTFILFAFFSLVFRILAVPTPVPNGTNELAQRDSSNTPDCGNTPNNTTSPPPSTSGPQDGGNDNGNPAKNTTSVPPTTSGPPDGGNSPDGGNDNGNPPKNTTSGPPDSGNPPNTSGPSPKTKGGDDSGNPQNSSGPSAKTKSNPTDDGNSSNTANVGGPFTGRGTYYNPSVGIGACGHANSDSDTVVAIPGDIYDSAVGVGPHCGQKVNIRYKGKSTKATVADKCPSCGDYGIDMSPTVFQALAQPSVGVIKVTWNFV